MTTSDEMGMGGCKLPASLKVGFSKVCPSPEFEKLCYKAAFTFYVPTICIRVLVIPPGVKRPHSAEIFHRFFSALPHVVSINFKLVTPASFTFDGE